MKIHTKVNENTYTKKVDENKYTKKVDENTYTTKVGENTYPTKVDENTNTSRQPGYIRCGTEGKATPLASGLKPCPLLFLLNSFLVNLFLELDIRVFMLIQI